MMRIVRNRVYADFFMPSRLDFYRHLLESALDRGYVVLSIEGAWGLLRRNQLDPAQRYLVLRHDVDTDAATAAAMWRIEHDLGIGGSYYFRLSTHDVSLMSAIAGGGGEASYHYEELATVVKRRRLHDPNVIRRHIPEAQDLFLRNVSRLREKTGLPMPVVASHGDFVNRAIGMSNWVILADPVFRRKSGVDLEVYDAAFMDHVTSRHADTLHPTFWNPSTPEDAFQRNEPVVYLLVHPRHWRVDRIGNARDDLQRLSESIVYRLPSLRR